MKSILKDYELENDHRQFTVQISEGGRVILSLDGDEANISVYMTLKDLRGLQSITVSALDERTNQVKEELKNE
jgi:hypothetical protein